MQYRERGLMPPFLFESRERPIAGRAWTLWRVF